MWSVLGELAVAGAAARTGCDALAHDDVANDGVDATDQGIVEQCVLVAHGGAGFLTDELAGDGQRRATGHVLGDVEGNTVGHTTAPGPRGLGQT